MSHLVEAIRQDFAKRLQSSMVIRASLTIQLDRPPCTTMKFSACILLALAAVACGAPLKVNLHLPKASACPTPPTVDTVNITACTWKLCAP